MKIVANTKNVIWPVVAAAFLVSVSTSFQGRWTAEVTHGTVVVCHHPEGNNPVTMEVPEHVLDAHLKHGDTPGACPENSSSSSSSSSTSSSEPSSSSSSSSSSSESSSSSSSESSSSSVSSSSAVATPQESLGSGGGGGSGGGDSEGLAWADRSPIFRGHGLGEHAAVLDFILHTYGLQSDSLYDFDTVAPEIPQTTDRSIRVHAAICSMHRYLQQLLVTRPNTPDDYIDWAAERIARAMGEDVEDMKRALLGEPNPGTDVSGLLQSVSDQGCAADEYIYAPEYAKNDGTPMVMLHEDDSHLASPYTDPSDLHVVDQGSDTAIAFSVMKGDDVFTDFGNSMTKEMHLIIVRDDLRYFYHVHPDRDDQGMWSIPFVPAAPGTYWIYINFSESDGHAYSLRLSHTYPGDPEPSGMVVDQSTEREMDGYHVRLETAETDTGLSFTYYITDVEKNPVQVRDYLGAFGHSIVVSTDGYFLHSHPTIRQNGAPTFYTELPPPGTYRIFTQFNIDDKVHTAVFDWVR